MLDVCEEASIVGVQDISGGRINSMSTSEFMDCLSSLGREDMNIGKCNVSISNEIFFSQKRSAEKRKC